MTTSTTALERLHAALRRRLGDDIDAFHLPPPSFTSMQGELLAFDEQAGTLSARFPILPGQLNPYDTLQGGFLAAAVDNTFGPLSLLVAPPNVTRRMELTYSRPIPPDLGYITIHARLSGQDGRRLQLNADVLDAQGNRLARARAVHWIIGDTHHDRTD